MLIVLLAGLTACVQTRGLVQPTPPQLMEQLRPGQQVYLRLIDGREFSGQIQRMETQRMSLRLDDGALQPVEYAEVEYIDARVLTLGGSLTGLLKGATVVVATAVGVAFAVIAVALVGVFR
ncbi:MAG: hypothetical protein ACLGHI_03550 [Gammaproteobacteria bacterium]